MPGWKVVRTSAPSDAESARSGGKSAKADATAPALGAVKAKYSGKARAGSPKKATATRVPADKKSSSVEFVTVVPENLPDNTKTFQKTVVCEDGEVIAVQG